MPDYAFTFRGLYNIIMIEAKVINLECKLICLYKFRNSGIFDRKDGIYMKLIYVIVRNVDSSYVTEALNKKGFYVTKLASTGGFLREGNTTLMIGTDEDKVDEVIDIVKKECGPRQQIISNPVGAIEYASMNVVVNVGGATIFVTDVDRYIKI
jgi:uncharacterized protein YaaQ